MFRNLIVCLVALYAVPAFAGMPGGQRQAPPAAVAAPPSNPTAPQAPVPQGALQRPTVSLTNPCPGLSVDGQRVFARDAAALQAGTVATMDACSRLVTAQAGAQATVTLAQAGAVAAQNGGEYVMVDAARQRVVTANGPAATWAAASNGGTVYPMGVPGAMGGLNPLTFSSAQLLGSGVGINPPSVQVPEATPAAPSGRPATTTTTRTQTTPATTSPPNNTAAAAAVLDAARK